jgi:iron complex outermembrane receptor protein
VTAGARYTREETQYSGSNTPGFFPFRAAEAWGQLTPRAAIKYKVGPRMNIYLSYSKGFKGGTFPYNSFGTIPINPETVDGYEAGVKTNIGRAVSLAGSVFYQQYKQMQVEVLTPNPVTPLGFLTSFTNAGKGTIYGFDIDASIRPFRDLNLGVKVEHLNTEYGDFPGANVSLPRPLSSCPPAALPIGCGRIGRPTDVSGNRIKNAPSWTGTFLFDYVMHPIVGDITLSANVAATSSYFWDIGNIYKQPGYILVGGRVSWEPYDNDHAVLSLWGKNLTNRAYSAGYNESNGGILWAMGRSIGIEASFKF